MTANVEVDVVSNALEELYNPLSSPRARRRADNLLQRFQRSPDATQASLNVLQQRIDPSNSSIQKAQRGFAASTIYFTASSYVRKYKLDEQDQWTEEEKQIHKQVTKEFGALCQQVWNILTGPNAMYEENYVQNHLASTIAVILLRFHEQHSDATVVNAIEWLISNQTNSEQQDQTTTSYSTNYAILLTLKVLPEEVENKRVKFTKTKRSACQVLVQKSTSQVIQTVLPSVLTQIDSNDSHKMLRGLLLKCFASWIEFGHVTSNLLVHSKMLERSFEEIFDQEFSSNALECIREVVRICDNEAYIPLMQLVMKNFVLLGQHLNRLRFCLVDIARTICECGQAFITYFVDHSIELSIDSLVYQFLDTIMLLTSFNEIEVSNATMDFWIDFRTYICGKHEEERMVLFEEFISKLLCILVERTEYPLSYETFHMNSKEQFAAYRNDVRGVFRSLATVNASSEDRFVMDAIQAVFYQYERLDKGEAEVHTWWRKVEVYIHALSAVSKSIRQHDTHLVPRLFELLSRDSNPFIHRALCRTITIFLGVMGHWFIVNPSYLDTVAYKIISQSLQLKEDHVTFPFRTRNTEDHVGAVALKKITSKCASHFFKPIWLQAMLKFFVDNHPTWKPTARLEGNSIGLIVDSIAQVCNTVSYEKAFPIVEEICLVMFQGLEQYTMNPEDEELVAYIIEIIGHLKIFATLILPKQEQAILHPILIILQQKWHWMEQIFHFFGTNEEVMEKMCILWTNLFENLRFQAMDCAFVVMNHLLEQFTKSFDGNFLVVIKSIFISCTPPPHMIENQSGLLIGDNGQDQGDGQQETNTTGSLTNVLIIVIEKSLSKIHANNGNVDETPQLIVALFDLIIACGSKRPRILVQCHGQLESILSLVLHALTRCQSLEVANAILFFLLEMSGWYGEVLRLPQELLQNNHEMEGKMLLHQLIHQLFIEKDFQYHLLFALFNAIAGTMPSNCIENLSEVVRSCWSCFGRQRSEELIERLLNDPLFIGSQVTPRVQEDFVKTIARTDCIDNARKFKRVLNSFCDHFKKTLHASNSSSPQGSPIAR